MLNENEVKEVARMQSLIDGYEAFILALMFTIKHKGEKEIKCPLFTFSELDFVMSKIWKWVKDNASK